MPRRDVWTPVQDDDPVPPRRFIPIAEHPKQDPFSALKENHMALILLGIVIGVIIMNMRPIIVNPVK